MGWLSFFAFLCFVDFLFRKVSPRFHFAEVSLELVQEELVKTGDRHFGQTVKDEYEHTNGAKSKKGDC